MWLKAARQKGKHHCNTGLSAQRTGLSVMLNVFGAVSGKTKTNNNKTKQTTQQQQTPQNCLMFLKPFGVVMIHTDSVFSEAKQEWDVSTLKWYLPISKICPNTHLPDELYPFLRNLNSCFKGYAQNQKYSQRKDITVYPTTKQFCKFFFIILH